VYGMLKAFLCLQDDQQRDLLNHDLFHELEVSAGRQHRRARGSRKALRRQ